MFFQRYLKPILTRLNFIWQKVPPQYFFTCLNNVYIYYVIGFIIDAFGALRDQMQGVDDELENNCFICGIGKDYLDSVPHGFDIHVQKEHNLANYLYVYWYFVVFIEYFS